MRRNVLVVGLAFAQFFTWKPVIGSERTDFELVEAYY
jgi:hypothetical protein